MLSEGLIPAAKSLPGFESGVWVRAGRKGMGTIVFDTEDNAAAAEPVFDEEMPRALGDLMQQFSGRRTGVDRYDVLVDERVS